VGNDEDPKKESPLQEVAERISYVVEPPEPLPDDKLREFVLALCDNRIFTSAHLRQHEIQMTSMVFMPLALGMFRDHTEKEMDALKASIGVFYEYYTEAGPRSVNGLPMFMSVRMLCKSDWERARKAYEVEMDGRKVIPLPT